MKVTCKCDSGGIRQNCSSSTKSATGFIRERFKEYYCKLDLLQDL